MRVSRILIIAMLAIFISCAALNAQFISEEQARDALAGWLISTPKPLDCNLSLNQGELFTEYDDSGEPLLYVINLDGQGFVFLSADDNIEPIIAFSPNGHFMGFDGDEFIAIVKNDLLERIAANNARSNGLRAATVANLNSSKWQYLIDSASPDAVSIQAESATQGIDDLRIGPLTESLWGQDDEGTSPCYNYYTPNNYPTGCVATAMAQYMRYFQYPISGIGSLAMTVTVDGSSQTVWTRGGDGAGGAYDWSLMPLDPNATTTTAQRQSIGALLADCGAAVSMSYTASYSSASNKDAVDQLKAVFGYSDGVYGRNSGGGVSTSLLAMINTNLDAGYPVMISLSGSSGGHSVLVDGYGYNLSTMYHHLNMGWQGNDNLWYALPTVDAYYDFDTVNDCCYNMFPNMQGEIISGRIKYAGSAPLSGAVVTIKYPDNSTRQTTSNAAGIYAFEGLPSNSSFTISVALDGYAFTPQIVSTGTSSDYSTTTGNKWAIDFEPTNPAPPIAVSKEVDAESTSPLAIELDVLDDGLPNPPASLNTYITSLPHYGRLDDSNGTRITAVPYLLPASSSSVTYIPCPRFGGRDSFSFYANDGGSSPSGGDSNEATIDVNVNNTFTDEYSHNNYAGAWPLQTSYKNCRTQTIYTSSDIGDSGNLVAIALNINSLVVSDFDRLTIRIKPTTQTSYSGSPYYQTSGWTTVFDGPAVVDMVNNWWQIDFTTPFNYNSADNLFIDISFSNVTASTDNLCWLRNESVNRIVMSYTNNASDPLSWSDYSNPGLYLATAPAAMRFVKEIDAAELKGDFNNDCRVDNSDNIIFAQCWLTGPLDANYNQDCDLDSSNSEINLNDFAIFAAHWLSDTL